jgi:hypothetical protein
VAEEAVQPDTAPEIVVKDSSDLVINFRCCHICFFARQVVYISEFRLLGDLAREQLATWVPSEGAGRIPNEAQCLEALY